jgi:hypothetical protein
MHHIPMPPPPPSASGRHGHSSKRGWRASMPGPDSSPCAGGACRCRQAGWRSSDRSRETGVRSRSNIKEQRGGRAKQREEQWGGRRSNRRGHGRRRRSRSNARRATKGAEHEIYWAGWSPDPGAWRPNGTDAHVL